MEHLQAPFLKEFSNAAARLEQKAKEAAIDAKIKLFEGSDDTALLKVNQEHGVHASYLSYGVPKIIKGDELLKLCSSNLLELGERLVMLHDELERELKWRKEIEKRWKDKTKQLAQLGKDNKNKEERS